MSKSGRAIGDLASILGGPVTTLAPVEKARHSQPVPDTKPTVKLTASETQPRLLEESAERSDRITAILPISLLSQVETRVASLRRKKKVSVSGYIEAALRELLATGEHDIEVLEKHRIRARRIVARIR